MPARVSEALVLRTYPLKEADLVVSFLTRDQGKLRGVAKRARRLKSNFGSGLERLSHVRMAYYQRESHELVNLDSCELIRSQFDLVTDYQASIALDFFAEASDILLPARIVGPERSAGRGVSLNYIVIDASMTFSWCSWRDLIVVRCLICEHRL